MSSQPAARQLHTLYAETLINTRHEGAEQATVPFSGTAPSPIAAGQSHDWADDDSTEDEQETVISHRHYRAMA
jgi:hypothetical protein